MDQKMTETILERKSSARFMFSHNFDAWLNRTNFDAEIQVISWALLDILNYHDNYKNIVILTDCKAAIQAVTSYTMSTRKALTPIQPVSYTHLKDDRDNTRAEIFR